MRICPKLLPLFIVLKLLVIKGNSLHLQSIKLVKLQDITSTIRTKIVLLSSLYHHHHHHHDLMMIIIILLLMMMMMMMMIMMTTMIKSDVK